MTEPEKAHNHEDRFRCPQCDRMVTVTSIYHRVEGSGDTLVQFDCSLQGLCGSPIWDPCPMYVAYMQQVSGPEPGKRDPAELS